MKSYNLQAFFGLFIFLCLFYPELFLGVSASLAGDHWEQHYPWAFLLSGSLSRRELPFWTPLIHCGFPIGAEGQIGIFYLPNLILGLLLPLPLAYSYQNLIHFLISGWGTYLYSRQMKLDPFPAFVAAFIFLFGTAYGGAFYNLTSLKTVAWFPLILFSFEKFVSSGRKIYLGGLTLFLALSLLAGYLQIAFFTVLIFLVYAFLRLFIFREEKPLTWRRVLKNNVLILMSVTGAFVASLPQLVITFQLATLSNRVNLGEDYAYTGSLSPAALLTFVFPITQGLLRGNSLYCGLLPIFLTLCAFFSKEVRKNNLFRLWVAGVLIVFFLALGRWSPLYIALIKLTHFYSFRIPAKFLVFICFGVSILSGLGVEALLKSFPGDKRFVKSAAISYLGALLLACVSSLALYSLIAFKRKKVIQWGEWVVAHFIYGKSGHPYSLETYRERFIAGLDTAQRILSFSNPWNLWAIFLMITTLLLVFMFLRAPRAKTVWLVCASGLTVIDLYAFSWADIRKDFDSYANVLRPDAIVERLKQEQIEGNLRRIYGFRGEGGNLPIVPSVNMIYGFEDIGAYSPFVLRRYYETIGLFGNVNDSNRAFSPAPSYVLDRLPLLSSLDVSHILSTHRLDHSNLQLLTEDKKSGVFLYQNKSTTSRAHFVTHLEVLPDWESVKKRLMEPGFNPREVLLLEASEVKKVNWRNISSSFGESKGAIRRKSRDAASETWLVDTKKSGFFVLTNSAYPGWRVTVNGRKVPLLKAYGLFQAVWLDRVGSYKIEFHYSPFFS